MTLEEVRNLAKKCGAGLVYSGCKKEPPFTVEFRHYELMEFANSIEKEVIARIGTTFPINQ